MAKTDNAETPEVSPKSAAVAVRRLKGELAALEREAGYASSNKDEVADAIKACKAELAKYKKLAG